MLSDLVDDLSKELGLPTSGTDSNRKMFKLEFKDDIKVNLVDNGTKFILKSVICPVPKEKTDALFSRIMESNLFGQATQDGVISLDKEGNNFCFSLVLHEPINYDQFRRKLEGFLNILVAWREEILSLKQ